MISFKIISDISDVDQVALPDKDKCILILSDLLDIPDIEVAYCVFEHSLIVRICDGGEYVFDYPYLFDGADATLTLRAISEYARRELIPLIITNVPREELSHVTDLFPLVTAQAFEEDEDLFVVKVENEISSLGEFPSLTNDGVTLKKIEKADADAYFALCTDDEVNRYWGYDYKLDNPNPTPDYFSNVAEGEFDAGVALALGIYDGERFVGECVMYDFDYFGSCEIGVRLLKSEQSKGYAGKAIRAIFALGRELGLKSTLTRVKSLNAPAIRFVEKYMSFVNESSGERLYKLEL